MSYDYTADVLRDVVTPDTDRLREELRTTKQRRVDAARTVLLRHRQRRMSLSDWQKRVADRYEPE